jgi:hypothetical protein
MTVPPSGASGGSGDLFPSDTGGMALPPGLLPQGGALLPLNNAFVVYAKNNFTGISDIEAQQVGTQMANKMVQMISSQMQNEAQESRQRRKEDWEDLTSTT